MKRAVTILVVVVALGGGGFWYYRRQSQVEVTVNTAPVTRGDIVDTVGATGTLQAVTTVTVGSQVSGNIQWLGADFNSIVKKDQVIARLDPSLFEAQLRQAQANLNQARANLNKAQSDLERNRVQLVDAQQKYARAKELAARNLIPQSDLDAAKIAVDSADAAVKSQQATVVQAQAAVTQAEATVNQNQVNLDHTIITAPIDGIVIQRSVDIGQTVAASMQAPTLFVIAADLTKMQVNANIDESDVGRIRPGQTVTFRVDAYPGETFQGTVAQVRLQPQVVQNVTTYGTIINVPNPDLRLKPGMTANLRVQIAARSDVIRVPNAAIRFRPTADMFAALNQAPPPEANFGGRGRGGRGRGNGGAEVDAPGGVVQSSSPAPAERARAAGGAAPARAGGPAGRSSTSGPQGESLARSDEGRGRGSASEGRAAFGDGRGGFARSGFARGEAGEGGDRAARMLERFKTMSPAEQAQFIARLKERGADVSAFERAAAGRAPAPAGADAKATAPKKSGAVAPADTIDALFAPLPAVESRGRVWIYTSDKQLKPVNVRLGITDGTNTELLSGDLQPGMEVVTGVVVASSRAAAPAQGNPLLPGGGRGPGGFGPGGFGGGRGRF